MSDWRPERMTGIEEQRAGEDLVLYDPRVGRLHHLNPTAAAVWRLCDGTATLDDIVARVSVEFALAPEDSPAADIGTLLREWRSIGIISN